MRRLTHRRTQPFPMSDGRRRARRASIRSRERPRDLLAACGRHQSCRALDYGAEKGRHRCRSRGRRRRPFPFQCDEGLEAHAVGVLVTGQASDRVWRRCSPTPINAAFSPDGAWVVYQSGEFREGQYLRAAIPSNRRDDSDLQERRRAPSRWSRDGRELFYIPGPNRFAVRAITTRPTFTFWRSDCDAPRFHGRHKPREPAKLRHPAGRKVAGRCPFSRKSSWRAASDSDRSSRQLV